MASEESFELMPIVGGKPQVYSSLDLSQPHNKKLLVKANQDVDAKLTEEVNMPLSITDYILCEATLTNKETGEVIVGEKLILIAKDGTTHITFGEYLIKSFRMIAFAYGPPPWTDGLRLTVKARNNGSHKFYFFDPD